MRSRQLGVRFDIAPADLCAHDNTNIVDLNLIEVRDANGIDQHTWCGQAKRQNGHKALAAGQQLGRTVASSMAVKLDRLAGKIMATDKLDEQ
jgi:hypothetical protein